MHELLQVGVLKFIIINAMVVLLYTSIQYTSIHYYKCHGCVAVYKYTVTQ